MFRSACYCLVSKHSDYYYLAWQAYNACLSFKLVLNYYVHISVNDNATDNKPRKIKNLLREPNQPDL